MLADAIATVGQMQMRFFFHPRPVAHSLTSQGQAEVAGPVSMPPCYQWADQVQICVSGFSGDQIRAK